MSDGSIPYLSEPWIEAAYTPESARHRSDRQRVGGQVAQMAVEKAVQQAASLVQNFGARSAA